MALPVLSVRADPRFRPLLQAVAQALREGGVSTIERAVTECGVRIGPEPQPADRPVGPYRNEDAAVAILRDRLIAALDLEEIWLFGSRGRRRRGLDSRVHEGSDFDILVVLKDGLPEESYVDYAKVGEPVAHLGVGCDVVPVSKAVFEEDKNDFSSLCYAAANEGVRLYNRPTTDA